MRKTRAHHWRHLWPVLASLALLALAFLSPAGSSAAPEATVDYSLYLPFVGKPAPTPTPTPTATPTPVPPDIRVNPACCNFRGGTRDDPTGEYVCFRSYDWRSINMTGWLVKDRVGVRYTFPGFALSPGAVVTVHSGQGHNTATDLYTGTSLIWNNDHDTVYLCDASGNEVDTYNY
jgi:competence protein ComEC